jgi:hypothetical protein
MQSKAYGQLKEILLPTWLNILLLLEAALAVMELLILALLAAAAAAGTEQRLGFQLQAVLQLQ